MKRIVIGGIAAGSILVIAIIIYFVVLSNKADDYREVKIYKVDGTTNVERSGDMTLDAYENMQLLNDDTVNVMEESYTQLKMDEDKYALLEPLTTIKLEATGNSQDSKTTITLEKGSIVNHIDNPLSDKSSYEINTPNSTMAVRGTSFKVETYYDSKGVSHTILIVVDGKVECFLVYPDGSRSEGRIFVAGQKVMIRGDSSTSEYEFEGEADLIELSLEALEFLKIHFNEQYFCTEQEINDAIDALRNGDNNNEEPVSEDNGIEDDNADNNNEAGNDSAENDVDNSNFEDNDSEDNNVNNSGKKKSKKKSKKNTGKKDEDKKKDTSEYTATFMYEDSVFATQKVNKGSRVVEPKLSPGNKGKWDYDFNSAVKGDVTIKWVDQ